MLVDDPLTVSDMDVIFTVITSPDSDKAKYWGHMPETVTNSAGVKFRRPLLAADDDCRIAVLTWLTMKHGP